jgi:hypothetical protein
VSSLRAASLFVVLGLAASCKPPSAAELAHGSPAPQDVTLRPSPRPSPSLGVAAAPSEAPSHEALTADAARELRELRKAAAGCPNDAPCEEAARLSYAFGLAHCGPSGIDRDYTFAWSSKATFAGAKLRRDSEGLEWYVGTEHSSMLARVDEFLYTEGDWTSVELRVAFEAAYFDATEVSRVSKLKAEIDKSHMPLALGFFYRGTFRGAFDYYGSLTPNEGGMVHGNRKAALEHPLCKERERRELPADLRRFVGQWSPLY